MKPVFQKRMAVHHITLLSGWIFSVQLQLLTPELWELEIALPSVYPSFGGFPGSLWFPVRLAVCLRYTKARHCFMLCFHSLVTLTTSLCLLHLLQKKCNFRQEVDTFRVLTEKVGPCAQSHCFPLCMNNIPVSCMRKLVHTTAYFLKVSFIACFEVSGKGSSCQLSVQYGRRPVRMLLLLLIISKIKWD